MVSSVFALGYATYRMRRLIQRKPDTDPPKLLYDFIRHSVLLKGAKV